MSNLIVIKDNQALTTTLAIADGTQNSHEAVIKLARRYQSDLEEFGPLGFQIRKGEPLPQGGFAKATEYALLNEHQATLLLTYMKNTEIVRGFKKRLVKAFFEMADRLRMPAQAPQSLPEALRLAAELAEQAEKQREQISAMIPKTEAYDRIATSDGAMCITNTAKDLQMRPKDLFAWLSAHQWIYKRAGGSGWIAYQDKLQSGVLQHKVTTVERSDGTEKTVERVLVTPKGLARLAKLIQPEVA